MGDKLDKTFDPIKKAGEADKAYTAIFERFIPWVSPFIVYGSGAFTDWWAKLTPAVAAVIVAVVTLIPFAVVSQRRFKREKKAEATRDEALAEQGRLTAERDALKEKLTAERDALKEKLTAERDALKEKLTAERDALKEKLDELTSPIAWNHYRAIVPDIVGISGHAVILRQDHIDFSLSLRVLNKAPFDVAVLQAQLHWSVEGADGTVLLNDSHEKPVQVENMNLPYGDQQPFSVVRGKYPYKDEVVAGAGRIKVTGKLTVRSARWDNGLPKPVDNINLEKWVSVFDDRRMPWDQHAARDGVAEAAKPTPINQATQEHRKAAVVMVAPPDLPEIKATSDAAEVLTVLEGWLKERGAVGFNIRGQDSPPEPVWKEVVSIATKKGMEARLIGSEFRIRLEKDAATELES